MSRWGGGYNSRGPSHSRGANKWDTPSSAGSRWDSPSTQARGSRSRGTTPGRSKWDDSPRSPPPLTKRRPQTHASPGRFTSRPRGRDRFTSSPRGTRGTRSRGTRARGRPMRPLPPRGARGQAAHGRSHTHRRPKLPIRPQTVDTAVHFRPPSNIGRTSGGPKRWASKEAPPRVRPRPALPGPRPNLPGPRPNLPGPRPNLPGPRPNLPGPRPNLPGPRPNLPKKPMTSMGIVRPVRPAPDPEPYQDPYKEAPKTNRASAWGNSSSSSTATSSASAWGNSNSSSITQSTEDDDFKDDFASPKRDPPRVDAGPSMIQMGMPGGMGGGMDSGDTADTGGGFGGGDRDFDGPFTFNDSLPPVPSFRGVPKNYSTQYRGRVDY